MCMEDVLLGRDTSSGSMIVPINVTSILLVPADPSRLALIIGQPSAGHVVADFGKPPDSNSGIWLSSALPPLILTIQQHGDIVRRAWYAQGSGPANICIMWTQLVRNQ